MNEINTSHLAWTSGTNGIKFKLTCKEKKEKHQIILSYSETQQIMTKLFILFFHWVLHFEVHIIFYIWRGNKFQGVLYKLFLN